MQRIVCAAASGEKKRIRLGHAPKMLAIKTPPHIDILDSLAWLNFYDIKAPRLPLKKSVARFLALANGVGCRGMVWNGMATEIFFNISRSNKNFPTHLPSKIFGGGNSKKIIKG